MLIKDLEVSKELTGAELCAVRGGVTQGNLGGQIGSSQVVSGWLFGSPVIQVDPQILTQVNTNVNLSSYNYSYTYTPVALAAGIGNFAFA